MVEARGCGPDYCAPETAQSLAEVYDSLHKLQRHLAALIFNREGVIKRSDNGLLIREEEGPSRNGTSYYVRTVMLDDMSAPTAGDTLPFKEQKKC